MKKVYMVVLSSDYGRYSYAFSSMVKAKQFAYKHSGGKRHSEEVEIFEYKLNSEDEGLEHIWAWCDGVGGVDPDVIPETDIVKGVVFDDMFEEGSIKPVAAK